MSFFDRTLDTIAADPHLSKTELRRRFSAPPTGEDARHLADVRARLAEREPREPTRRMALCAVCKTALWPTEHGRLPGHFRLQPSASSAPPRPAVIYLLKPGVTYLRRLEPMPYGPARVWCPGSWRSA